MIAFAYFIFVPKIANSMNLSFKDRFIIKYAHSIVWLLLAVACVFANYENFATAQLVALAALFTYLIFIITSIKLRTREKNRKRGTH